MDTLQKDEFRLPVAMAVAVAAAQMVAALGIRNAALQSWLAPPRHWAELTAERHDPTRNASGTHDDDDDDCEQAVTWPRASLYISATAPSANTPNCAKMNIIKLQK